MTAKERILVWWRMLRPFTLTASLIPVLTGTILSLTGGRFHAGRFLAFLLAAVLIQSATNMFNEYFDFKRGLDTKEHVGIAGTIVRDGIRPGTVLSLAWLFSAAAVAIGLYIAATTSWWVFAAGLACIGVAYLYSAGPVPLAYTPFGELAAGFTMGPVMIMLVYYTQALALDLSALLAAQPIGLLIASILLGNNIRDMEADRAGGRRTLAILLGRRAATLLLACFFGLTYLITLALVGVGSLSPWTLLVLATVPSAVRVLRLFSRESDPPRLNPAVKGIARLLAAFGALLVAGMLLSVWL
ncbi:MAG: 1,4-dihydroxy-2-naphthoate polyprenyltransferase [Bacillota bacterium]